MSQPRKVVPQSTYLITRRTVLRHMLLRPDPVMNEILVYLLAVFAERTGMKVHAFCAMSTHIHLVVTDELGKLPVFLHGFHRLVALCTRAHRQWNDAVWDKSPTSVVHLATPEAVVEKIAYVIANPVAAGLVRSASEWPGAKATVDDIGQGTLHARRPKVYLNPKNRKWTAEATLAISLPPGVEPSAADSFRRQVATEVERLEAQAGSEMKEQGRRVLGADRAGEVSPTARATSVEPLIDRNPTFAVGHGQGEARDRAVAAASAFQSWYRGALQRWRGGERNAAFPHGTWLMRVLHGAETADLTVAA